MTLDDILILTPRITPIEARLVVRLPSDRDHLDRTPTLAGHAVGPYCEYAKTLTDKVSFQMDRGQTSSANPATATARLLEPCFWDPQHPFRYELQLELNDGTKTLDSRKVVAGIRHFEARNGQLLLNGKQLVIQGVQPASLVSAAELHTLHDSPCNVLLTAATTEQYTLTDRFGPAVFHQLSFEPLAEVQRLRNHPSVLLWLLPASVAINDTTRLAAAIRDLDPSRPIGRLVTATESTYTFRSLDVLFMPADHPELADGSQLLPVVLMSDSRDGGGNGTGTSTIDQAVKRLTLTMGAMPAGSSYAAGWIVH